MTRKSDPDGWYDPDGTETLEHRLLNNRAPAIFEAARLAAARIAELEVSRDHYRTASDSATLRAAQLTERNNYQSKRIAELEDKIARLDVEGIAMRRVIAELEAERDRYQRIADEEADQRDKQSLLRREAEAERDRLKAALTIGERALDAAVIAFKNRDQTPHEVIVMQACHIARDAARAALSGEGVTK